jgi:uncharacterized membrane protein YfcA
LTVLDVLLIAGAGLVAGVANAVVGSGTLLTFPVLLAVGYPPLVANVSNTVGLTAGNVSGVVGYRRELAGQRRRIIQLGLPAAAGSVCGALLLLALPESVFRRVVPILVLFATLLVIAQPRLSRLMAEHRERRASVWALVTGVFLTGIYGGYFGAGQGVMLIGVLSVFVDEPLHRLNGLRNVLALVNNGVAALLFAALAHVSWAAALVLAVSSLVGGQAGAVVGRRLPPNALRAVIVVAGLAAVVKLAFSAPR